MTAAPPYLSFDPATRRLRLDPHEPAFFQDPYAAYRLPAWRSGRPSSGRITASGASAASTRSTALLRDRRLRPADPARRPRQPRRRASDRSHLAAFDAHRGQFDAGARAAGPYAAAHAGQPRLRLAPGRAAAAARRGARQRADRRVSTAGEVDLLPAFAAPLPITSSPRCSACRSRWDRNCSTGRTAWSPCTCTAAPARPRRRQPGGARVLRFPARLCRRAAQQPGDDLLSLLIAAQDGRPEAQRGRADLVGHPAAQCRPRGDRPPDRQCRARDPARKAATRRRFFASPEATAATVEECLRFDAPLHMFTRYAYEDDRARRRRAAASPASRSA